MKKALASGLVLASQDLLAHPGHGMPGWLHPHAGDYALIALGIAVVAVAAYGLKKICKKRK